MKTVDQVKKTIADLISANGNGLSLHDIPDEPEKESKKAHRKRNKDRKEIEFLNGVKIYLESNPREDFVVAEEAKVKSMIDKIVGQWGQINKGGKLSTEAMNSFFNENDMKKLKKQFRTLNYILS